MKEIERRFLVTNISNLDINSYEKETITQEYIYTDKITSIRKRMIEKNGKNVYYHTIKIGKTGKYGKEEIETKITKDMYENLQPTSAVNVIRKNRYIIPIEEGLKIELDIFKGIFEGIIYAEIEFPTEELAESFKVPQWFDKELSNKITNSKMSKLTRKELDDILKNI